MASPDDLCDGLKNCSLEEGNFPNLSEEGRILLKSMTNLHCQFTWNLPCGDLRSTVARMEEKLTEIAEDEEFGIPWCTLIVNLLLSYKYCLKDSLDSAFRKQEVVEEIVNCAVEGDSEEKWCIALGGLQHVVLSSKCFLLLKDEKYTEAEETFKKIVPLDALDKKDQASIWGIRAALFMEYGYAGSKEALIYIEKAIALDQVQGEWLFLRGKALGRIRRVDDFFGVPSDLEISSLQRGFELTENVSHMIFLAQVLRESALKIYSKYRNDSSKLTECEKMNERSYRLYKIALDLHKDCTHVNIRCAQGFMLLPFPYRDMKLAHTCIKKALELAPNNGMANHWAGKYYDKEENVEKAAYYLGKAHELNIHGATMDLLKLKWRTESRYDPMNWQMDPWQMVPKYDPLPFFEKALEVCNIKTHRHTILGQLGSYWYFIKGNFKEALKSWKEVLNEDPSSSNFQNHRTIFLDMKASVDIKDIILNEALLLLDAESTSAEDREVMEMLIKGHFKGYTLTSPVSWREKVFNEIVRRRLTFSARPNRGHVNGQGKECGHGQERRLSESEQERGNGQEQLRRQTSWREDERWKNTPQGRDNNYGRRENGEQRDARNRVVNWRSECLNRETTFERENLFMHGNYNQRRPHSTSFRTTEWRIPFDNRKNSSSSEQ